MVTNLTGDILELHRFDAHRLHLPRDFRVEILQLVEGEDAVAVEVETAEPVFDAGGVAFVLFGEKEGDEVGVVELIGGSSASQSPRYRAAEHPLDYARRNRCNKRINMRQPVRSFLSLFLFPLFYLFRSFHFLSRTPLLPLLQSILCNDMFD